MGAKFIKKLNAAVEEIRTERENATRHAGRVVSIRRCVCGTIMLKGICGKCK